MGVDAYMTIYSKLREDNYKKIASQMSITFLSTTRKFSHDVDRHSRDIVRIHT
jgi:hypothetical protein